MKPCDWCDRDTQSTCPQCGGDGYSEVETLRNFTKNRLDHVGEGRTEGFTFLYDGDDGYYVVAVTLRKYEDKQ